jgi:hypothetical protein
MNKHGLAKNMQVTVYRNGIKIDVGQIVDTDDTGEVLHIKSPAREYHFIFWEKGSFEFLNDSHTFEEDGWREVDFVGKDETALYADMLYEFVPLQRQ